jgi:hypothetical protein
LGSVYREAGEAAKPVCGVQRRSVMKMFDKKTQLRRDENIKIDRGR